ncbi:MAG: S8 family serine peptidase [Cyanobacteria bacterium P01_F01_bin.150]
MSTVKVLVEIETRRESAFELHKAASASEGESLRQAEVLASDLGGLGLDIRGDFPPVPLFSDDVVLGRSGFDGLRAFTTSETNSDLPAQSEVIAAEIDRSRLDDLAARSNITVWPNSELTLLNCDCEATPASVATGQEHTFDRARSSGGIDCRPFKPGVSIEVIRELLGVSRIWQDGFRGQNMIVGIIDEGVNGDVYPVVGGFSNPNAQRPGTALITSHGSMCAADVLVAAPAAKIYDYPFLGIPNSGGALRMFQAVLEQRRIDGTPHLTNNSYGFVGVPPRDFAPRHEIWDMNHPLHRKVREVIASGAAAFFAAGNCGANCPSGVCHSSGIGPGRSIHASNSLAEVITVAAVNSAHERIGYSSQGPGLYEPNKPDIAAYSHFFANFGPGRPGGLAQPFDNGTSAATPLAAGVGALLMSAFPELTPNQLKAILIKGASNLNAPGWDPDTGHGVINAAAAYSFLCRNAS